MFLSPLVRSAQGSTDNECEPVNSVEEGVPSNALEGENEPSTGCSCFNRDDL